jgi:hypothetical protein
MLRGVAVSGWQQWVAAGERGLIVFTDVSKDDVVQVKSLLASSTVSVLVHREAQCTPRNAACSKCDRAPHVASPPQ